MSVPQVDLRDLIGLPFVDRGRDALVGLDCWGLVMEVHRRLGHEVPDLALKESAHNALASYENMRRAVDYRLFVRVEVPFLGDVVAMALEPAEPAAIGHFGVYLWDRQFIHTLLGHNCRLEKLNDHFYKNKIRGFYRWAG